MIETSIKENDERDLEVKMPAKNTYVLVKKSFTNKKLKAAVVKKNSANSLLSETDGRDQISEMKRLTSKIHPRRVASIYSSCGDVAGASK